VDREARHRRKRLVVQGLRRDEERHDELVEREPRLADEAAQPARAAEAAEPDFGKRAHAERVRAPRRASAHEAAPMPASQAASTPTACHGLVAYSAAPKNRTACANGRNRLTQYAAGTAPRGTMPRKTTGKTMSTARSDAVRASRASAPSSSARNVTVTGTRYDCTCAESSPGGPCAGAASA